MEMFVNKLDAGCPVCDHKGVCCTWVFPTCTKKWCSNCDITWVKEKKND